MFRFARLSAASPRENVSVATHYFRRSDPPSRRLFRLGTRERYELWHANGEATLLTMRELDDLLAARRFPAAFWAAVHGECRVR
jgi:hypothetical protein